MSFADALIHQAKACEGLGSAFTGQLCRVIAANLTPETALMRRLLDWPGDVSARGDSVPLRLAGALHGLVIDGSAPELAALYPPNPAPADRDLWQTVQDVMHSHTARLDHWLDRPPQTNEIGRSACLIAAAHWLAAQYDLPIVLSELGASGGLNLNWDHYALQAGATRLGPNNAALTLTPDWAGNTPEPARVKVAHRRGVDLTPLDASNPDDALRLQAYLWPDQPERLARTRAALHLPPAPVDPGDAADWLDSRLAKPMAGHLHLIYHTIAWQYFPPETSARARSAIETAGARASTNAPLAWLRMEGDDQSPGAGMSVRLWPGDRYFDLGRIDFHGRWVDWRPRQG